MRRAITLLFFSGRSCLPQEAPTPHAARMPDRGDGAAALSQGQGRLGSSCGTFYSKDSPNYGTTPGRRYVSNREALRAGWREAND